MLMPDITGCQYFCSMHFVFLLKNRVVSLATC